ncbi:MAG: glycogen/starch/alpha-glucan phosphorylase [Ruthenibacterium sp.]
MNTIIYTTEELRKQLQQHCAAPLSECTDDALYAALLCLVKELAAQQISPAGTAKKKVYYISAEFLIGKLLSNNLINLGIYDEVRTVLAESGKSLSALEEREPEPSLGNGGLGRLAACFLDSMATLGIAGDGIGLNYHLGLFRQQFAQNRQRELPNPWMEPTGWLTPTDTHYTVQYRDFSLTSRLYDIAVTGYHGRCNALHLFDVDSVDESLVTDGITFDKTAIAKNLTLFLYPDDSDKAGELLRIYQQYFMVSNAAQLILDECCARGCTLHNLADYAAIQINDTHPTLVIPELIRLLTARGIREEEAVQIVSDTCAYTNHTILAEALETWPLAYLDTVVPQLVPIIKKLHARVRKLCKDEAVAIIDKKRRVHMAHIDLHFTHSTNGVAALHTQILKETELNAFYKLYPQRFNNKTNGITFRRWLLHCNRPLTDLLTQLLGDDFKIDATALAGLSAFAQDDAVLNKLLSVKRRNKAALSQYLLETQGIKIPVDAIYDIQVKRLHEYKRQQLNVLYLIHKYFEIKAGKRPSTPIIAIFGAKAAPAYTIAKDIIHAILCLQQIVNSDVEVSPYLKIVMVENYNVTKAEKLIPACDISEQISLASKEASGTGNMKFMLNGAVTLGTLDGANVEIAELVGKENIYVFGAGSAAVIDHYKKADYVAKDFYNANPAIRQSLDFLVGPQMLAAGDAVCLTRLYKELLNKDWFMTLLDFDDYLRAKEQALTDYADRRAWARKMLMNIANAGYFSSDRTIAQYNAEIWHAEAGV